MSLKRTYQSLLKVKVYLVVIGDTKVIISSTRVAFWVTKVTVTSLITLWIFLKLLLLVLKCVIRYVIWVSM